MPSSFAPRIGGVEELTLRLAQALMRAGDEVEVWACTPDEDGVFEDGDVEGVVVRRFSMPLPPANLGAVLRDIRTASRSVPALLEAYRRFRPDVLHVQCFSTNGAYATVLSYLTNRPLVISLQGETFMDDGDIYSQSAQLRFWLREGLKRAGAVTGCSEYVLRDADRFGLPRWKASVVFNGVDLTEPHAHNAAPDEPYVLAVGRVVPNKGFDLLLRAWALVCQSVSEVRLLIAGGGPHLPELKTLTAELGLAHRVELVGPAGRADVGGFMAGARCLVVPSRIEPFGIVVLEGWRAGVPVVVTRHGGPREFVTDGFDAILADPFDAVSLAEAIIQMLRNPVEAAELGTAGGRAVHRFAWRSIAPEYRALYRAAQAQSPPPLERLRPAMSRVARMPECGRMRCLCRKRGEHSEHQ